MVYVIFPLVIIQRLRIQRRLNRIQSQLGTYDFIIQLNRFTRFVKFWNLLSGEKGTVYYQLSKGIYVVPGRIVWVEDDHDDPEVIEEALKEINPIILYWRGRSYSILENYYRTAFHYFVRCEVFQYKIVY